MDVTASAHAAALWSAGLIIVLLVLSLLVVRQRVKHKVLIGDDGIPELVRAVRAFGNAAEYAPAGVAALAVLALVQAPLLVLHVAGLALVAGRVSHAVGLSNSGGQSIGRGVGMLLTWLAYIFIAVILLIYAVV
jgi:uncharacterized membrane protein YecN with MAPEG domain